MATLSPDVAAARRLVVKIGSALLVDRDRGLKIEVSDAAKDELGRQGYDPQLGARPVKRVIQQKLQNQLAMKLLEGGFTEGDTILVNQHEGLFTFSKK